MSMVDPRQGKDEVRFSRQLRLEEFGRRGQAHIREARALVVGCGGLGAPVIQYLAAAGVGRLVLVDDDVVEHSNLNRQVIHRTGDVGRRKAERATEWVRALGAGIQCEALTERITTQNARERVAGFDAVVDCTDGLPNKFLLNDACVRESVPLVHGAVTALYGQLMLIPAGGRPCLRCLFPTMPAPEDVPSCQTAGVLGAVCGVIGALMAVEAVKLLAQLTPQRPGWLISYEGMSAAVDSTRVGPRPDCPSCGAQPTLDARHEEDYALLCSS